MVNDFASPAHAAANPAFGPACFQLVVAGRVYTGAHTARAIKSAVTRAGRTNIIGVRTCGTDADGTDIGFVAFTTNDLPHLALYLGG
jgi:hypothetical protein